MYATYIRIIYLQSAYEVKHVKPKIRGQFELKPNRSWKQGEFFCHQTTYSLRN
jgi:hypothetical protein